jgi:DNA polymerase III subunit epsilon
MKPIVFLDLETTGTNTSKDRIVQIGAIKAEPTLLKILAQKETLINPMIPIPKEATDIHGITDEMVKDAPTFAQISKSLHEYLLECDYAGYNILTFDVPMLSAEFERCGLIWPLPGSYFIDAMVIFREKEKRDLAAAVTFYTGKTLEGAHGAVADCKGTLEVLRGQIERYPDLSGLDVPGLHKFCMGNRVDLAGKLIRNEAGDVVYGFGKDIGKPVQKNPGFANWMLGQDFPIETKRIIREILNENKA